MTSTARGRGLALGSLLIVMALAGMGRAAADPTACRPFQWNLDIDQAMDAIGVHPDMVVGEAGAGEGYFTLPMAKRVGAQGAVYANDIDRRALEALARSGKREGLSNIHTVVGTVDDPLFPRQDLELVVLVHAFHDFDEPVAWLVNVRKYLRAGATVAIIDRDPARGAGSHFLTRDRILDYATQAGYTLVKSVDAETDHLILVLRPGGQATAIRRPADARRSGHPGWSLHATSPARPQLN